MSTSVFKPTEFGMALGFAVFVEGALVTLLALAGAGTALSSEAVVPPPEVPIAVTPVIEDVPLLKYGNQNQEKLLPDMWRKPKPKKRYEDKSAASTKADKELDTIPTNELAKSDETPAPEDAELAKKVDEDIIEDEETEDPNTREEGHADGVIGGTETDALKAFVISQYKAKLIAWFEAGFRAPQGAEFCDVSVAVSANLAGDRTVTSFSLSPSGNGSFDGKVRAHMDGKVGRQVPPPPPKYPELGERIINLRFSGENSSCKNKSSASEKKPDNDSPSEAPVTGEPDEAPSEPAPAPPSGDDSVDGLLE